MTGPLSPIDSYLDRGMTDAVREIFAPFMAHTYTRTPTTAAPRTPWAQDERLSGTPLPGRACRYLERANFEISASGYALIRTPPLVGAVIYREVLLLPWDDDLAVFDLISGVAARDGVPLLAGPVPVMAILDHAGLGPVTNRIAVLRGATVEAPSQ